VLKQITPMSASGQHRFFDDLGSTSALPPKAAAERTSVHISKVPTTDSCALANHAHELAYSITSSARARKSAGIVNPSALAVLILMTSWKRVGCSTGKSPG
jgi:hypothetical protein